MRIETDRLIIRSVERGDEMVYADMAKDGSLLDVGFDINCAEWIEDCFVHYSIKKLIATVREENVSSWKPIEKVSFQLVERKMYQDINDAKEELYRFYEIKA